MNANELADIQAFKTEELTIWERNTTATMLRQQQAEIEALNELNTMLKDAIEKRIEMDAERYKWLRAEFAAGYLNGDPLSLPLPMGGTALY